MRIHLLIVSFLVLSVFAEASAQATAMQQLDSLAGKYIRALRSRSEERIYLQTDRPVYRSGEQIFFKAFVVNAVSGKPSRQSSLLYVELVDERDSIRNRFLLNAGSFKTDGSFSLPDTITSGHYWLRAYTRLSLQHAATPMAVAAIYVINSLQPDPHPVKTTVGSAADTKDSVWVQFFPEGGTLVGGATTLVAIRTTDPRGNPVAAKGFVKDEKDSVVAMVTTDATGLGKFRFFCWTWRKYQLHLQRPGLADLRYTLPAVNLFGAQLAVQEVNGVRKLRVLLEDSVFRRDKVTYVLGITGDSLCFSGVGRGSYDLVIPEYRFPKGVAHFVLFDDKQQKLSERAVYLNGNETNVQLAADKPNYVAREKVNLSLQITDADNRPQVASFSVEVNDITRAAFYEPLKPIVPVNQEYTTIALSDVTGTQQRSAEDWELLLLTQKNRLVQVDLHQSLPASPAITEDSSFYLAGKVLDERNRPQVKKIVTIFGDLKTKLFETDTTDAEGRFLFPFTAYDDQTRFNLQVTDFSGRLYPGKIQMDTLLHFPRVTTPEAAKQYFEITAIETVRKTMVRQSVQDTLTFKRGKEWLTDVTVTGLVKKDPGYDVKKRQSLFSKIIPPEVFAKMGGNSLSNAIFRVPGIHLRNGYVTVNGGNSFAIGAATEPLLLIDGVPIPSDTSDKLPGSEPSPVLLALNRIDPSSVEFIEVLTGPEAAIYGVRGGNGVIIVNTRTRMQLDDAGKANGIRNLLVKGLHVSDPFVQRDYAVKEIRNSKVPDTRTLIFWNGDGLTDDNGKATISFYTADAPASYQVTVTGITATGMRFVKSLTLSRK
jgi:TonB-dependent SusC/RagA subfamily outer membrane receptor